jgi:hypothetical protein
MAEIKEIKYTQKQFYEAIIAIANGEQTAIPMDKVAEFAEKKLVQLENKTGKVSAKRTEEVDAFIDLIRDVLAECADARGMQCGAIAKDARIAEFKWADGKETSSQRVSAMLKKMVESGDVAKVTDKKVTYFHLA